MGGGGVMAGKSALAHMRRRRALRLALVASPAIHLLKMSRCRTGSIDVGLARQGSAGSPAGEDAVGY